MISAGTAIRRYCRFCCNDQPAKDFCVSETCPLFPVKSGGKVERSNLKRIRERCLNCVGTNSSKDVTECKCTSCWLYLFRSGHSPNVTEETKQKARDRMTPERIEKTKENLRLAREKKEKMKRIKEILENGSK